MPKKTKGKKVKVSNNVPDTSRGKDTKSYTRGKELRVDKELEKKKDVKEKDVFDFSYKK